MAPSELAWLDFSEAEQRRAREAVQLFAQRDSRDELGTGVLRDIVSDRLFLESPCYTSEPDTFSSSHGSLFLALNLALERSCLIS